jgi:ATP-dependent Zn protease
MRARTKQKVLENTAYHEAGHAVAAHYRHVKIQRATIVATADYLGCVSHAPIQFAKDGEFDDSLRGIDRAERSIIVCYAGPLASRKFQPQAVCGTSARFSCHCQPPTIT